MNSSIIILIVVLSLTLVGSVSNSYAHEPTAILEIISSTDNFTVGTFHFIITDNDSSSDTLTKQITTVGGSGSTDGFDLIAGHEYTVSDNTTLPDGFALTDEFCEINGQRIGTTFTLNDHDLVVCTFTNTYTPAVTVNPPTLTIKKFTDNFTDGKFHFIITDNDSSSGTRMAPIITTDNGNNSGFGSTIKFDIISGHSYTISEGVPLPDGLALTEEYCLINAQRIGTTFTPVDDDDVLCIFVNTYTAPVTINPETVNPETVNPPILVIIKNTFNLDGTFDFIITDNDSSSGTLTKQITTTANTGNTGEFDLISGHSYTISEDTPLPDGFALTDQYCVLDGQRIGTTFTLVNGDFVVCVSTNTYTAPVTVNPPLNPPTLIIVKNTFNLDGTFDFTVTNNDFSQYTLTKQITTIDNTSNTGVFDLIAGHEYTVSEDTDLPDGFALTGEFCVFRGSVIGTTFTPVDGDFVACTFTNTYTEPTPEPDPTPVNPAFAVQSVNDRIEIDDDNISSDIAAGDRFGYEIENIGDLDNDGVTDLATIKFLDDSGGTDAGSILILFMNSDGTVKGTNEITIEDNLTNGIGNVCFDDIGNQRESRSLAQLAFVGDLDGDGMPTLALGAPHNDHNGLVNSGAVYMLELNTDGTVDNCLRIIPGENGFNPDSDKYLESEGAFFGWPLLTTDLNGDGINELLVGAGDDLDQSTNMWVLFLTPTGAVNSHPVDPIYGISDLGISGGNFTNSGDTVNGGTKIVIGVRDQAISGAIFIINLNSTGAFSSSVEITGTSLGKGIAGDDIFGSDIVAIGDLDGDGVDDIMVGNIKGDDTNDNSGEAYILFMNSDDTVKASQKISNESEFARNGSTPFAAIDLFGQGMTLWRETGTEAIIAIGAYGDDTGGSNAGAIHLFYIERTSSSNDDSDSSRKGDNPIIKLDKSGGSRCADCIPPTLGLNANQQRIVDNGFTYNGNMVQVDKRHTAFPLINATVGETNTVEIIVYENQGTRNMKMVQFGLGGEYIGQSSSTFEVLISVPLFFNNNSQSMETGETTIIDKHNLIENSSVNPTASIVSCGATSDCVKVILEYSYREATINHLLVVNVWDVPGNSRSFYFNHGVQVVGDSLNPADITTTHVHPVLYPQTRGLVELTQIDRAEKLWTDPYGYVWQGDDSKMVLISTLSPPPKDNDSKSVFSGYNDRINSHFAEYKQEQIDKATILFDSSLIQGDDLSNYVAETIYFEIKDRANDSTLQQRIIDETNRAQLVLEELLSKTHRVHMIED